MNPRCRKQSAYIHYFCISLDASVYPRTIGFGSISRRWWGRVRRGRRTRYNRINHKSSTFPRKWISVIYIRWMVCSAKETSDAIVRLKHDDEIRNKFAKQRIGLLKSPVCFRHTGNISVYLPRSIVSLALQRSSLSLPLVSSRFYFSDI